MEDSWNEGLLAFNPPPSRFIRYLCIETNHSDGELLKNTFKECGVTMTVRNLRRVELQLTCSRLTPAGLDVIAGLVRRSRTLTHLSLLNNPLQTYDLTSLVAAVQHSRTLWHLDCRQCGLNDSQALLIAKAIEVSRSLEEVYLHNNSIGNVGGAALAYSIARSHSMNLIGLLYNPLTTAARAETAYALWHGRCYAKIFACMCALAGPNHETKIMRLLKCDGDNAQMIRVLSFLL